MALSSSVAGASNGDGLANVTERGDPEPTIGGEKRTVSIRASEKAKYSFSVTGLLNTASAPDESVNKGTASASIENETHQFEFSGEFTEFEVEGNAEIYVDGDPFDVELFPHNTLTIVVPARTEVDISASGRIETADSNDELTRINSRRLSGEMTGRTTFKYTGKITYFEPKEEVRTVKKNGEQISADEILPSKLPSELQISGENEEVSVRTSADAEIVDGSSDDAQNGTITARLSSDDVVARYDGNIKEIEHETGATIKFVPSNMRIICSAPESKTVEFSAEAANGVVHNRTKHSEVTISVEGGESKQIKYYGDVTSVSVEGVELSIAPEVHEEAITSAKLQHAALFERTDEYEAISEDVEGRICHDSESLYYRSTAGQGAKTLVTFQIIDSENGDYGIVSLSRSDETGDITNAGYEMIWEADDGYPGKMEVNLLASVATGVGTTRTFETRTVERGEQLPEVQASGDKGEGTDFFGGYDNVSYDDDVSSQIISLPSLPSLPSPGDIIDYFGSSLDSLASEIGVAQDTLASITSEGIEAAEEKISGAADDIAINAGVMIIDAQELLIEIAAAAHDQLPRSDFWDFMRNINPNFASTVLDLADAGVFDELADSNFGCAGCIAIVALSTAVAISFGASAICGAMISTVIFAATCGFFVAELIGYIDDAGQITQTGAEGFCGSVAGVC